MWRGANNNGSSLPGLALHDFGCAAFLIVSFSIPKSKSLCMHMCIGCVWRNSIRVKPKPCLIAVAVLGKGRKLKRPRNCMHGGSLAWSSSWLADIGAGGGGVIAEGVKGGWRKDSLISKDVSIAFKECMDKVYG